MPIAVSTFVLDSFEEEPPYLEDPGCSTRGSRSRRPSGATSRRKAPWRCSLCAGRPAAPDTWRWSGSRERCTAGGVALPSCTWDNGRRDPMGEMARRARLRDGRARPHSRRGQDRDRGRGRARVPPRLRDLLRGVSRNSDSRSCLRGLTKVLATTREVGKEMTDSLRRKRSRSPATTATRSRHTLLSRSTRVASAP